MKSDWMEYWDRDNFWFQSELLKVNARLFLEKADPIVHFNRTDSVLNVGCGPGFLEKLLAPRVESVWAVDVSQQAVQECQKNCQGYQNVTVRLLGSDYTDLSMFGRRFSLFLCVSVVQYYEDIGELETLIRSAHRIALPGARMLIADLPQKRGALGFAWDGWRSFLLSIQEGYPLLLVTAGMSYLGGNCSKYRSFRSRLKTLSFPIPELHALIQRLGLAARIIPMGLTVYPNRPSLFIQF